MSSNSKAKAITLDSTPRLPKNKEREIKPCFYGCPMIVGSCQHGRYPTIVLSGIQGKLE